MTARELELLRQLNERGLIVGDVRIPSTPSRPALTVVPSRDRLAMHVGALRAGSGLARMAGGVRGRF